MLHMGYLKPKKYQKVSIDFIKSGLMYNFLKQSSFNILIRYYIHFIFLNCIEIRQFSLCGCLHGPYNSVLFTGPRNL